MVNSSLPVNCLLPCGFPCGSAGKESACSAGDLGLIPWLGRSPGEEKGYPLQYSGLENSIDCTVHRVAKSQTRVSNFHFYLYIYIYIYIFFFYPKQYSITVSAYSLSISMFFNLEASCFESLSLCVNALFCNAEVVLQYFALKITLIFSENDNTVLYLSYKLCEGSYWIL